MMQTIREESGLDMLLNEHQPTATAGDKAILHMNDKRVGVVIVAGSSDSWAWGEFTAEEAFAEFAPLFGIWSLVMHADEGSKHLRRAASDELRQAEAALDMLHCQLHWPGN